jgi:hypothetical protein
MPPNESPMARALDFEPLDEGGEAAGVPVQAKALGRIG